MKTLNKNKVDEFKNSLMGRVVLPDDNEYDKLRKIWNAMIDRKSAIIVQCTGVADVIASVNFARDNNILTSVRGVGRNR